MASNQPAAEEEEVHIEEVDVDPDYNPGSNILSFPGVQAGLAGAIQAQLAKMVGRPSGYLEDLPPKVKARVQALRDIQDKHDELEDEYSKEVEALNQKYQLLYNPLYAKRASIVVGAEEPPEAAAAEGDAPPGIPDFWLAVLRSEETTGTLISEKDEPILAFLLDISCEDLPEENGQAGYRLTFKFAKNPYFDEEVLTKAYYVKEDEDGDMELESAVGTTINWKPGKNPTVKILKKKPKPGKGGRAGRVLTKEEPTASFFNFFSPPVLPEDDDDGDEQEFEERREALEEDLSIGEVIKHNLIPKAVRYYTGEIVGDGDDEDEDDDYDEEDEEDDEDDDDEEEEERPRGRKRGEV